MCSGSTASTVHTLELPDNHKSMNPHDQAVILTLAKVLVATAWVDGDLSHDEINAMKFGLLSRIPNLSTEQWASVTIYMDSPVDQAERARLIEQLQAEVSTPAGKQLVFDALDSLIAADGQVTDEECRIAGEIKVAIESGSNVGLGRISRLFKGRTSPATASAAGPNREAYLDDYIKNRVYYVIRRRLEQAGIVPRLSDADIRKLSLAGGMMALVARINPQLTEQEQAAMRFTLQQTWHLNNEQAAFLVDVAVSQQPADLDGYRLADGFAAVSDYDERAQLVDSLFAVAAADGTLSNDEIETIRTLANTMVVTHERFIEAKLKVTGSLG